ncbi:hypothetical protein BD410DRAFT_845449 [Rickenella mellea]|uniref:Uncharacterized protein n=1 Tax=Rickenella mellea TaxID=50990 RepID=A0A4Y7PI14_9AGAM|nr:hypothetical protein BD410DRAFT_845449 [Rickenella mellea]
MTCAIFQHRLLQDPIHSTLTGLTFYVHLQLLQRFLSEGLRHWFLIFDERQGFLELSLSARQYLHLHVHIQYRFLLSTATNPASLDAAPVSVRTASTALSGDIDMELAVRDGLAARRPPQPGGFFDATTLWSTCLATAPPAPPTRVSTAPPGPAPQTWYYRRRPRDDETYGNVHPPLVPPPGFFSPGPSAAPEPGVPFVPMMPMPAPVGIPAPFNEILELLRQNRLAQTASIDQQREIMRYMRGLNEWLEHDVCDRWALYAAHTEFEIQHGMHSTIKFTTLGKRRIQYKEILRDPNNYDMWFDYARLEERAVKSLVEESASVEGVKEAVGRVREVYERAVANVPPGDAKRFWRRYIFL